MKTLILKINRLFLLLAVSSLSLSAFSQNPDKEKKTYTVNITKRDTTIKADVLADKVKFSADKDRTYHWFASNRILETQGGYDGHLLHGGYTSFYGNNNLRQKGKFKNGLKEGKWITWFVNGHINEISYWKQGMKNGKYVMYDGDGKVMLEARFKEGKLHGTMTSYASGKVLSERRYKNGAEVIKNEPLPKVKKEKRVKEKSTAEKIPLKERLKKLFPVKDKSKSPEKKEKHKDKSRAQASQS